MLDANTVRSRAPNRAQPRYVLAGKNRLLVGGASIGVSSDDIGSLQGNPETSPMLELVQTAATIEGVPPCESD
jgi:hypothetical protein